MQYSIHTYIKTVFISPGFTTTFYDTFLLPYHISFIIKFLRITFSMMKTMIFRKRSLFEWLNNIRRYSHLIDHVYCYQHALLSSHFHGDDVVVVVLVYLFIGTTSVKPKWLILSHARLQSFRLLLPLDIVVVAILLFLYLSLNT